MGSPGEGGLRARLGRAAERVFPGLDDRAFTRTRDRAVPDSCIAPVSPVPFSERPAHVVVVPHEEEVERAWKPGMCCFSFETYQSAREAWGDAQVSVFPAPARSRPDTWIPQLIDHIRDTDATHVVTHIEHDPGGPRDWNWDRAWARLAPNWDGVLLGVLFDSAFPIVRMKARRLARISPNFVAVDLCDSLSGVLVGGRPEVGPATMPVSRATLELLGARLDGVVAASDVSFIGAMYPYRVDVVAELRALGVDVAVNPHRTEAAEDFESSRREQPGWLDYMAALAGSRLTLNFSRSSAGEVEQYKWRVIEATLAGTLLLTDDRASTRQFFEPDAEFGTFSDVADLPSAISRWLGDPTRLDAVRAAGKARAWSLAPVDFWNRIDAGLCMRGLPRMGVAIR